MSGWQYKQDDGEIVGILSDDEMKSRAERGALSLKTPVMHEVKTKGKWVAAKRIDPLRQRIEAVEQQRQQAAAPEPEPLIGYVPPPVKKTSATQLRSIWQGLQQATAAVASTVSSVASRLTEKKPLHACLKCEGEFAKYEVLGKCPLCGEWAIVCCETCGLESGAKRFVENDCKCPRCSSKVTV